MYLGFVLQLQSELALIFLANPAKRCQECNIAAYALVRFCFGDQCSQVVRFEIGSFLRPGLIS